MTIIYQTASDDTKATIKRFTPTLSIRVSNNPSLPRLELWPETDTQLTIDFRLSPADARRLAHDLIASADFWEAP